MIAYELEPWHDFFVMTGGASAALAGLLFVAVSLNLEHVLKYRPLPTVAASSVSVLIGVVIASALGLAPGIDVRVYGITLLVLALLVASVQATQLAQRRTVVPGDQLSWRVWRVGGALAVVLPLVVAGISLAAEAGGGLYWVLAWIVVALIVTTCNAWVLLVEIRR